MNVRAIDFVELRVADVDGAVRFYRDTLGMDFPLSGGGSEWKEFGSPPVALALGRGPEPPGSIVLGLAVDDVDAAVEELRAKGVPILREPWAADVCYRALIQGPGRFRTYPGSPAGC